MRKKILLTLTILLSLSAVLIIKNIKNINEFVSYIRVNNKIKSLTPVFFKTETLPYGTNPRQYVKIYYPENPSKNEIVFYIHGGGWKNGSPEGNTIVASFFVSKGYITVMPAYGLVPETVYPQMAEDIFKAFKSTDDKFSKEKINIPPEYIICGASAGASLAAILISDKILSKKYSIDKNKFKALITFGGVLSFSESSSGHIASLISAFNPENIPEADPISLIDASLNTDVFCIHSESDGVVPFSNSASYIKKINSFHSGKGNLIVFNKLTHDRTIYYPFIKNGPEKSAMDDILKKISGL